MTQAEPSTTEPATGGPSRTIERFLVALIAAAVFISVLNTTMVNVALPSIGNAFTADPDRVGWLATLYSLMFGVSTPFYGRLGDRYGLRRMYVAGLSVFVVSSFCAAISPNFWFLLVFRIGQGMGSAAIPSLGTAMITRTIPSGRRGASVGLIGASVGVGQAIGPTLGGTLTEFLSWRAVFFVSCLLAVLIPLSLRFMQEHRNPSPKPVDWLGGIALGATIAGILFAVSNLRQEGFTSTIVIGSLVFAALALVVTIRRHTRAAYPFIERVLIENRRFVLLCGIAFLAMGANLGTLVLAPFLLEEVNALSTASVGLVLLPQAAMLALLSRTMGGLTDRFEGLKLVALGLGLIFVAIGTLATFGVGWSAPYVAILFGLFGIGQALVQSPLLATVTRSVPQRAAGTGIGIYNMLFFIGGGFGTAISTVLLATRTGADSAILPFYSGAPEFPEFSDAYLYILAAVVIASILLQFARHSPMPESE